MFRGSLSYCFVVCCIWWLDRLLVAICGCLGGLVGSGYDAGGLFLFTLEFVGWCGGFVLVVLVWQVWFGRFGGCYSVCWIGFLWVVVVHLWVVVLGWLFVARFVWFWFIDFLGGLVGSSVGVVVSAGYCKLFGWVLVCRVVYGGFGVRV